MGDVIETTAEVSKQLDVIAASLPVEDSAAFDENPSWLLEDIRELKQLNRLKLIRALPEKEEIFRPKSSKKAVACDFDQLPSVLIHSKVEAARGKSAKSSFSHDKRNNSTLFFTITREEATQRNLDIIQQREQSRRNRRSIALKNMASSSALPLASTRYLERREKLSRSPLRGTAGFRTHETIPRPRTAPNRGRMGHPQETKDLCDNNRADGLCITTDDVNCRSGKRMKSPSPEKYKNPEDEKKQRSKILVTVLMGWWYAKNLKLTFTQELREMVQREAAAIVLQKKLRALTLKKRKLHAANVVPPCLRRAIIRYRKRKYIGVIKSYLVECAKNQKSKIIRQFLYRVRRLQKLIKNWLVTQRARVEILKRYWDKIEYNYRKNLADEYRAAQELLIETERRLKKRARAPIAELWSKTNTKVCLLLKKAERVQLRAAREKAFEDNTEMPIKINISNDITLGEFEGKISDDIKLATIYKTVKSKRDLFLNRKKLEKMAATQAVSSKAKVNEELVRRLLSNYKNYSAHVVRVQMVTCREVARQQRDTFTRAQNVCFLTNPHLGPMLKHIIEGLVWTDIQEKKQAISVAEKAASANRLQRLASMSSNSFQKPSRVGSFSLLDGVAASSIGPESEDNHSPGISTKNNENSQNQKTALKSQKEIKQKKVVRISTVEL